MTPNINLCSIYHDLFIVYCNRSSFDFNIIKYVYNQPHRYYHNINHLYDLINQINEKHIDDIYVKHSYLLAALFHDWVYDPTRIDNEEKSVEEMLSWIQHKEMANNVRKIILETKDLTNDSLFNQLDRNILKSNNLAELIEYEHAIFKEYQFVPYEIYKQKRIDFINSVIHKYPNLSILIPYIESRKIKIGIYCGTFRSFHLGHNNILEKAKKIFDKVIIAKGKNDFKADHSGLTYNQLKELLKYHEVVEISSSTASLYESYCEKDKLYSSVTVIKGIRSSEDLDDGLNLEYYSKLLNPNYSTCYITCDPEFRQLSSSHINMLKKYNENAASSLLFKGK